MNDILKKEEKRLAKEKNTLIAINKKRKEVFVKSEIRQLAQDNLYMYKRLVDLPSNFNVRKWEQDYKKSQNYKKNICNFPSIDFTKKIHTNLPIIENSRNAAFSKKNYFPTQNYIKNRRKRKVTSAINKMKNGDFYISYDNSDKKGYRSDYMSSIKTPSSAESLDEGDN